MALTLVGNSDSLNQRNRVVLNINGRNKVLFIKLRWHQKINKWLMSIADENNVPVIRNVPLVQAWSYPSINLLRQFGHLDVGEAGVLKTTAYPSTQNPSRDNLGVGKEWLLVWGLPDE